MATERREREADHAQPPFRRGVKVRVLTPLIANVKFSGILDHHFNNFFESVPYRDIPAG